MLEPELGKQNGSGTHLPANQKSNHYPERHGAI